MRTVRVFLLIVSTLTLFPTRALGQTPAETYIRARVITLSAEREDSFAGITRSVQDAALEILDGPDAGETITVENGILDGRDDMRLSVGETVVMEHMVKVNGQSDYFIREKYRLPSLLLLLGLFFGLAVVLGGRTGFSSIVGLMLSMAILAFFVVPQIAQGRNPLMISVAGAAAIACTSLYLAHGFKRRTTIALFSTILTLGLSTILAVIFVDVADLFGMGTEESVLLQFGPLQQVNLRGLLLGGIVIGALGVLDDITTAQTAAVDELSRANQRMGYAELYRAGTSIGREHIASLINTLALAYAGASLPLLLLFSLNGTMPLWVILNGEFLAEEIVRTLVGSSALLLAVPISTWIAAQSFAGGRHSKEPVLHNHTH